MANLGDVAWHSVKSTAGALNAASHIHRHPRMDLKDVLGWTSNMYWDGPRKYIEIDPDDDEDDGD
eukprot:11360396-Karenia_brevis.AAC.1